MPELGPQQPSEFVPSFIPDEARPVVEEQPRELSLIEYYAEAPIVLPNGKTTTLKEALEFEDMFCPVPAEQRKNPLERDKWAREKLELGGVHIDTGLFPVPDTISKEQAESKDDKSTSSDVEQDAQKKTEKSELPIDQAPVKPTDKILLSPELDQVVAPSDNKITETIAPEPDNVPEARLIEAHEKIHEYQRSQEETLVSKEVNVVDVIETKETASQTEPSVKMAKAETTQEDHTEQMEFATEPAAPFGEEAEEIVGEVFPTGVEGVIKLPSGPIDESVELPPETFDEADVAIEPAEPLDEADVATKSTEPVAENIDTIASPETLEFAEISPEVTKLIVTLVAIDAETSAEALQVEPSPINALVVERIMQLEGEQKEVAEELVGELMQHIESFDIFAEAEVQQAQHAEMEELVYALFESLGITATEDEVNAFIGRLLKVQLMQQSKPTGVLTDLHDPGTYERRKYFALGRKNVASFFELPRHLKLGQFTLAIHNIEIVPGTA